MNHLLDANALIALGWPTHQHHAAMLAWFRRHAARGWATTAFTQAAFVRIISQPTFSGGLVGLGEVVELLLRNTAHPRHVLLPQDFGIQEVMGQCTGGVVGHRQVTDAYLLTTAIRAGMKLLTFDAGVAQLLATDAERQRHLSLLA